MTPPNPPIAGLILAGGLSRRMGGGDKTMIEVEGQSLLDRVIERLSPQVGPMILNANGDPDRFAEFTLPVVPDVVDGYAGPLVGVLTGLEWLKDHTMGVEWMVSTAADTPLFPLDLVERLHAAVKAEGADIAVACTKGQAHPVFALWPVRLAAELRAAVVDESMRKIDAWTDRYKVARVEWPVTPADPFFNVNTPEDVVRLRLIVTGRLPPEPPLSASTEVAVVVERRDGATSWIKNAWRPLEVVAEPPPHDQPLVLLRQEQGFEHYLIPRVTLALHRSDLASYRYNLGGDEPRLYVVLRPQDDAEQPVRVVMVTAAPDQAQAMSESGEDMVDGLPMPKALRDWVEMFCACHPPDEPMKKRKRDTLDAEGTFAGKGRRS
ncbi:bifunctional molybdenum cofactor guanylyltransferase MobA/molybdopterin-guanine dinucleotide biosynthesis adaptor protein MobB [Paramagnetospirillum kuznetsovii]|uniref:Molybdenum cofactor guanylyltransferase n=1 Tax=Paramagnetospirillum kuznetsovii TaxID=2053833 RepID=A0A364NZ29_9PROT|nr:molybdenum cofactor guanylyltransferase MobA [Paramagnetospirillum kuznetsovii]RAU22338.1 bifunctional molybdenum cofactor guanylyltransferase MobA/molybdopterin-guanine dinucleotide biosynthesis adaptor protein MobB [Paramagnetospirillum kuznetsovii]